MNMDLLAPFFRGEGIEYFGILPLSACRVFREDLFCKIPSFRPKTVILYAAPYYAGESENLSRYAAARDYHLYMKGLSERLIAYLQERYPQSRFLGFSDHSPIDERDAAARCGLGIWGDNGLLINEKYGSFLFLGEIFTDLEPLDIPPLQEPRGCLHCGACKRACPTGALTGAGECLSALTQQKGELPDEVFSLMKKHKTVWGCDLCQLACPYNKRVIEEGHLSPISFFRKERIPHLTYDLVENMKKGEFQERAFAWRGRNTILRNLARYEEKE